uniref:Uncharacterized protein n=1 Tax=Globodera rostochiensis TaxID=31243 RepID=A0A914GXV2_GLORO
MPMAQRLGVHPAKEKGVTKYARGYERPGPDRLTRVLELCYVLDGQRVKGEQSANREMIGVTAVAPTVLKVHNERVKGALQLVNNEYLTMASVCFENAPLHVDFRVIGPPSIVYRDNATLRPDSMGEWKPTLRTNYLLNAKINRWVAYAFDPRDGDSVRRSSRLLEGSACTPHYTLLREENDLSMDTLQAMVHCLCFGHQFVTKPTLLPSSAKRNRNIYAHNSKYGLDDSKSLEKVGKDKNLAWPLRNYEDMTTVLSFVTTQFLKDLRVNA